MNLEKMKSDRRQMELNIANAFQETITRHANELRTIRDLIKAKKYDAAMKAAIDAAHHNESVGERIANVIAQHNTKGQ